MDKTASSDTPSPVRSPYHMEWTGWEKLRLQAKSTDTAGHGEDYKKECSKAKEHRMVHLHVWCSLKVYAKISYIVKYK